MKMQANYLLGWTFYIKTAASFYVEMICNPAHWLSDEWHHSITWGTTKIFLSVCNLKIKLSEKIWNFIPVSIVIWNFTTPSFRVLKFLVSCNWKIFEFKIWCFITFVLFLLHFHTFFSFFPYLYVPVGEEFEYTSQNPDTSIIAKI